MYATEGTNPECQSMLIRWRPCMFHTSLLTRGENSSYSIRVRNILFLYFARFTRLELVKIGPHSSPRPADMV